MGSNGSISADPNDDLDGRKQTSDLVAPKPTFVIYAIGHNHTATTGNL